MAEPSSPLKSPSKFRISALSYDGKSLNEQFEENKKLLKKLDKFIAEKCIRKEKEH